MYVRSHCCDTTKIERMNLSILVSQWIMLIYKLRIWSIEIDDCLDILRSDKLALTCCEPNEQSTRERTRC
jgi:hypothetical protein